MITKVKSFVVRNERKLSIGALLLGFIIDNLTLRRVDLLIENIVFISYLLIAGFSIAVINLIDAGKLTKDIWQKAKPFLFLLLQFAFGGLFSGFFVFYSRSASLASSWPFLLILGGILLSTELMKERYARFTIQVGALFLAVYSFTIFYLPVLFKSISPFVFILSGVVSLSIIYVFLKTLRNFLKEKFEESKRSIKILLISILAVVNIFYFLNIIPPIPLSLKEASPYHSITSDRKGGFIMFDEEKNFIDYLKPRKTLHLGVGESAYVYSSIFAPTKLNTEVVHEWQYFNKERSRWESQSDITYPIIGGRDGGYRGFSTKSSIWNGLWRVNIRTGRGQLIGRVVFNIEIGNEVPFLKQIVK